MNCYTKKKKKKYKEIIIFNLTLNNCFNSLSIDVSLQSLCVHILCKKNQKKNRKHVGARGRRRICYAITLNVNNTGKQKIDHLCAVRFWKNSNRDRRRTFCNRKPVPKIHARNQRVPWVSVTNRPAFEMMCSPTPAPVCIIRNHSTATESKFFRK